MQVFGRPTVAGELALAARTAGINAAAPTDIPVVLVHGMGSDHSTWRGFASTLRGAGRAVVSVDLRGHGRSGRSNDYALESFATDLGFVLDALGLSRVDVVGHSLGAHTALRLAMAQPDRIRSLVLEEVPPMPRDQHDLDENITPRASLGEQLRGLGMLAANPLPLLRFDKKLADVVGAEFQRADIHWWDGLASVSARTLIISGGARSFLPAHHLKTLGTAITGSRFATIEAGHSVHRDKAREFAATAGDFLADPAR